MSVTNDCQFYIDCKKCYHRAKQETKCVKCGETRFVERVPLDRVRPVESLSAELGQLFVDSRGIVHKVKKKVQSKIELKSRNYDLSDKNQKCSICMDMFIDGDIIETTECNHKFHAKCVQTWLLEKSICPECRTSL